VSGKLNLARERAEFVRVLQTSGTGSADIA